jgi:hypothetical protein
VNPQHSLYSHQQVQTCIPSQSAASVFSHHRDVWLTLQANVSILSLKREGG